MLVIKNENSIFFDCDDTLVMWDNKYKNEDESNALPFLCYEMTYMLVPHWEQIKFLKECKAEGRSVIVWSAGGWEWSQEVVRVLKLENYVDAIMSKPCNYVDDLHCTEWMGTLHYKEFNGK